MDEELYDDGLYDPEAMDAPALEPGDQSLRTLMTLAQTEGDLTSQLTPQQIATIGADVVHDYDADLAAREPWARKVRAALKSASQEIDPVEKTFPFPSASNIDYPLLTMAALQFHARCYPAVVKGDEAVYMKVLGQQPQTPAEAAMMAQQQPQDPQQAMMVQAAQSVVAQYAELSQRYAAKQRRAARVKSFMNYCIFYQMEDWEADTDALLLQLPIVGCAFRKVWWDADARKHCSAMVHALRLVVPIDAKSLDTTPRITEEVPEVYPYQIRERQRSGLYRDVSLPPIGDDAEKGRLLLEQHRLIDLDGDGVEEPYIVTVDHHSREVLSVQSNFAATDVKVRDGRVVGIRRGKYFVKYSFIPHPEGKFYDIGFGHLLDPMSSIINTAINQINDAATAANAGGGFIFGGLRLQGAGKTSKLTFQPGEYKMVGGPAAAAKDAIWERTSPGPSPVTFQVLDLMLGAARELASIKDVVTGDAPATAPVGTVLALIEQGLQVFNATYKRVYRALKEEFALLFECMGRYADEETNAEYVEYLDDPEADFAADFDPRGADIRPVSDPQAVTRMQKIAKSQVLLGFTGKGLNDREIYRRAFEAMDIDDIDALLPPANPQPDPMAQRKAEADITKTESEARKNVASAAKSVADAERLTQENEAYDAAMAALEGGMGGMVGGPVDPMGPGGAGQLRGPAEGPMGPDVMGAGAV